MARERLVTLTGPGGTGKTRLCVETARSLLDEFPDGVWFVALESVHEPELVVPTIARTLAVPEEPGRDVSIVLADRLANRRVLLVLDNLEQVVQAAPSIASLVAATSSVSIVGTSREPLAVAQERIYPVAPLATPGQPGPRPTVGDLAGLASIELFVERARAVRPDFRLTDENAAAVAEICRGLDGLPLAIELAAARLNVLTPDQVLQRLSDRLTLLASTRRDMPARQRTLRGAIDWSHDLLPDAERAVFRRLAVFSGGADLDAIQAVVDPGRDLAPETLDLVSALVDRSLLRVRHDGGEARFLMLETIREFAGESLASAGESAEMEARHAAYFAAVAEALGPDIYGPRQAQLLDRLERDLANLRAAIAWSLRTGETEPGMRLLTALAEFWHLRNHITEAVRALDALIEASASDGVTLIRERAIAWNGGLRDWLADPRALPLGEAALAMAEALHDVEGVAIANSAIGWAVLFSDSGRAMDAFAEGREAARASGNAIIQMQTLTGLSWAHLRRGDHDGAARLAYEAIAEAAETGVLYLAGFAHVTLGLVAGARDDLEGALGHYRDALTTAREAGAYFAIGLSLDAIATVALERHDAPRAIRLAAAAKRLRTELGSNLTLAAFAVQEPLDRALELVTAEEFERHAAAGRALSVDEAVEMAFEEIAAA